MSGRVKRRGFRKTPRRGQLSRVLKHEWKLVRRKSNPDMLFTCQLKGSTRNSRESNISKHGKEAEKGSGGLVP